MKRRRASCSCGQLSVSLEGEPLRVSMCHCLACQQRTGSVFGVQARWRPESATISGTPKVFVRVGDAGSRIAFHFCPECATTLYWTMEGRADEIAVAVGAFADPSFPGPVRAVYESRKHPWLGAEAWVGEHFD